MKQKILILMISLLLSIVASAYDIKIDGICYNLSKDTQEATVTHDDFESGNYKRIYDISEHVTIPKHIIHEAVSYNVVSIGDSAFYYATFRNGLTLQEGLVSIGRAAFMGYKDQYTITTYVGGIPQTDTYDVPSIGKLPNSIKSIGACAFMSAPLSETFELPGSLEQMGDSAFFRVKLTSIVIPGGVKTINKRAFAECEKLANVTIENGVKVIGERAFEKCGKMVTITFPNTLESIGMYAFFGCSNLETLIFPSDLTAIGRGTFISCKNINNDIVIPMGVTQLSGETFEGCSSIKSITMNGVRIVQGNDFSNCISLEKVVLGNNVGGLMPSSFKGCTALRHFYCSTKEVPRNYGDGVFSNSNISEATLHVPASSIEAYSIADNWKDFGTIVALQPGDPGYEGSAGEEAYAVLTDEGKTVTFYYDAQKASRSNVVDINNDYLGVSQTTDTHEYVSLSPYGEATQAVFDASFADYRPTSTAYWFTRCYDLVSISGIENLNTSEVTDMRSMFNDCSSLTSLDVSGFNTSNVTLMNGMFNNCSSLTSLDVSGFNTSNVTAMNNMFSDCSSLTSLDVSSFNTSNVMGLGMMDMFKDCSLLTILDLSSFDTGQVTWTLTMFYGCSSLKTIYVSDKWSIEKVEVSTNMFKDCTSLVGGKGTTYDADHVDATYAHIDGGTENPGYLTDKNVSAEKEAYAVLSEDGNTVTFYYDTQKSSRSGVMEINNTSVETWNGKSNAYGTATTAVIDASFANNMPTSTAYWFDACTNLTSITGMENLNTANVTDMNSMFYDCKALTSLDVSHFNTTNVTNMFRIFSGCSSLTSLDVSGFNTSNVTDMNSMFFGCRALKSLDVSKFSTANVTRMSGMFAYCNVLENLDVSHFNTEKVMYIQQMFHECKALTSLDVSGFNTSNARDMCCMFKDCISLTNIDVSNFNAESAQYVYEMFSGCSGLKNIDLNNFSTPRAQNMRNMFYNCSNLTTIYADEEKWSTEKVTNSNNMFKGCTQLVGGNGTAYDADHTDYEYARIDKAGQKGYLTKKTDKEINPIETLTIIDSSNLKGKDLTNNTIEDVYYNLIGEGSGYDASDGSVVIGQSTNMMLMSEYYPGAEDVVNLFSGIILKIGAGKGTISLNVKTVGHLELAILAGWDTTRYTQTERGDVVFNYDFNHDTYVYIFAVGYVDGSASPKRSAGTDAVKIYNVKVDPGATSINTITNSLLKGNSIYTLDGRKLADIPTKKGLYIVNGMKVIIK